MYMWKNKSLEIIYFLETSLHDPIFNFNTFESG